MTSNKQSAPCNKHCMPSDKRKGFTLLEVLVALAVLAAGAVALGHYAGAFNRVSSAEIAHAVSLFPVAAGCQYEPPFCRSVIPPPL